MMSRIMKICILCCGFLLIRFGITYEALAEKTPIRIGQITGFTNPVVSVHAIKLRSGAQMALKEINDKGGLLGRNLELLIADDQSDTTLTISHARRLKENGVIAIVAGTISTEALALGKWSMEEGNIPIISGYAASNRLIGHPWVFRHFTDDQIAELGLVAMKKKGKTNVGIEHTTLAYGIDAADTVEKYAPKYGIKIVRREGLEFNSTDATVQAMKLRDAGSGGVILCDYGVGVATFAKALNTIGWHPPFTSSWSNVKSAVEMSSPPTLMDGGIGHSICGRENPRVIKFIKNYAKFVGEKVENINDPYSAAMGYSCVMMFAKAVMQANSDDPTAIRDALYKVKFKDLPLGNENSLLYFTPERNWIIQNQDYSLEEVKGGKLIPLK